MSDLVKHYKDTLFQYNLVKSTSGVNSTAYQIIRATLIEIEQELDSRGMLYELQCSFGTRD